MNFAVRPAPAPRRPGYRLHREAGHAPVGLEFHAGAQFTVGVEDELMLVDDAGALLGQDAAPVMARLLAQDPGRGTVTGEVYVDQVELGTPVCGSGEEVAAALGAQRRRLTEDGLRVMAVGVHPQAELGSAVLASSPRYDPIVEEFAGLFRTPTAAFQVHVGLPDEPTAIAAYRGLRNRLALFRALAAGSPFWHGRDSGLASARSAITRSYPRVTVPPVLRTWDDYLDITERILAAEELPDYTYVWWDLRPQPLLGTLEIRVMDAQASLAAVAGLTALAQGLARYTIEAPDGEDLPDEVVAANDRQACRYGLDAHILDVEGIRRPLREVALRAVADARGALAPEGSDRALDAVETMIFAQPEPERQRQLRERAGMAALLADLMARTGDGRT